MGQIPPVREKYVHAYSCFAYLIFMNFCFAVSTHTDKSQNVKDFSDLRLQKELIKRQHCAEATELQNKILCVVLKIYCCDVWNWECYRSGCRTTTGFQFTNQEYSLGFHPSLKTKKLKANPFSSFQSFLSSAHIWDNIFIQPLPAVLICFTTVFMMIHTCCDLDWGCYAESISIHIQVGIWMFSDPAFPAISALALVYND